MVPTIARKVSVTVCSSVDSVKKVSAKGTSGKDMDVGYDPLVRSVGPGVQESDYKYEGIGAPVETIDAGGHEPGIYIFIFVGEEFYLRKDLKVRAFRTYHVRASPMHHPPFSPPKPFFGSIQCFWLTIWLKLLQCMILYIFG